MPTKMNSSLFCALKYSENGKYISDNRCRPVCACYL